MTQVTRTLEYKRVRWHNKVDQTAEMLLRQCWGTETTQTERTIQHDDQVSYVGTKSRNDSAGGFAIHCAQYVDKQSVGSITMIPKEEIDIEEHSPDSEQNFINSDFMALVYGDHVISMSTGRNSSKLQVYMKKLFRKYNLPESTQSFSIVRVSQFDRISMIRQKGVQSIDLKIDISEVGTQDLLTFGQQKTQFRKMIDSAKRNFFALIEKDETAQRIREATNGTYSVCIDIGKRSVDAAEVGIDTLAEDMLADESADNYVIKLRDGTFMKPSELSLSKEVKLEQVATSVSRQQTWDAMETYLDELKNDGFLEQD